MLKVISKDKPIDLIAKANDNSAFPQITAEQIDKFINNLKGRIETDEAKDAAAAIVEELARILSPYTKNEEGLIDTLRRKAKEHYFLERQNKDFAAMLIKDFGINDMGPNGMLTFIRKQAESQKQLAQMNALNQEYCNTIVDLRSELQKQHAINDQRNRDFSIIKEEIIRQNLPLTELQSKLDQLKAAYDELINQLITVKIQDETYSDTLARILGSHNQAGATRIALEQLVEVNKNRGDKIIDLTKEISALGPITAVYNDLAALLSSVRDLDKNEKYTETVSRLIERAATFNNILPIIMSFKRDNETYAQALERILDENNAIEANKNGWAMDRAKVFCQFEPHLSKVRLSGETYLQTLERILDGHKRFEAVVNAMPVESDKSPQTIPEPTTNDLTTILGAFAIAGLAGINKARKVNQYKMRQIGMTEMTTAKIQAEIIEMEGYSK